MKKVFVSCKLSDIGIEKLKDQSDFNVVVMPKPSIEEVKEQITDADAILIKSNVKLTEDILEKAKQLKVIVRAGAGVDNVNLKMATDMGIPVTNTPGLNSNSVAEQVFCYIHTFYKNIRAYDSTCKAGEWNKGKYAINELRGKTIGIGGLGAIGRRVLEKARGYRMNVKVYDPFVSNTLAGDMGFEFVSDINELFKTCDIVTVHMPATPETKSSITKETLSGMKENAIFINTARGTLLPPNALEDALEIHPTLKAAVDVLLEEGTGDKALAKFGDRVIITPHVCGNAIEGQLEIAETAASIIIDALSKNKLRNLVNFVKIPDELDSTYLDLAVALGHGAGALSRKSGQLEEVRITCYGKLQKHTELLIKPAVKGVLSELLSDTVTLINADSKAKELGVKTVLRDPDASKQFGASITVDVVTRQGNNTTEHSLRGKLIENAPAFIRIDNYEDLTIKPVGNQLFFEYQSKPGIIGAIASILGENNINIDSVHARNHVQENGSQLLVMRTEQSVPNDIFKQLCEAVAAKSGAPIISGNQVNFEAL